MVRAYIIIKVARGKIAKESLEAISRIEGVRSVHACWGQPGDFIAFAEVADDQALKDLVLTKIHGVDGVTETNTRIVLEL